VQNLHLLRTPCAVKSKVREERGMAPQAASSKIGLRPVSLGLFLVPPTDSLVWRVGTKSDFPSVCNLTCSAFAASTFLPRHSAFDRPSGAWVRLCADQMCD
jgi:hypothetical protein